MPFTPKSKLAFKVPCELTEQEVEDCIRYILFNLFKNGLPESSNPNVLETTTWSCKISLVLTPNIVEVSIEKQMGEPFVVITITARLEFLMLYFRVTNREELGKAMRPWFEGTFAKRATEQVA